MDNARGSRFSRASPAFFNYSRFSLGASTILWASKLFTQTSEKKEVNALKFMKFAQSNYDELFAEPYYSENLYKSWPVTREETEEFITETEGLIHFPELRKLRNSYYAHFEKKYLFDRTELFESNKVTLSEIDRRAEKFHEILMRYSLAFDGSNYRLKITNINDLQKLVNFLEKT